MKKFVQKFRRDSGYEERSLVKEFKREMNRVIQKKCIETEIYPMNIKEWYEYATNLDRHWRKSRRKEERLRDRREIGLLAPRTSIPANTGRAQWQKML